MSREEAVAAAHRCFDDGTFLADLARRVAIPTESQRLGERAGELVRYLDVELRGTLEPMGFTVELHPNPAATPETPYGPFLIARRVEDPNLPTVLVYGHGDVVAGQEGRWADGRDPWTLDLRGDFVYGRGVADNKGQHSINISALEAVLRVRGRLGVNVTFLVETGEEAGSPGLHEFVAMAAEDLAADVLIASDGPRLVPERPTIFLGARGALNLVLEVVLRHGAHHSGNWGGLLANPGVVLANAIASIIDGSGHIRARELVPRSVAPSIREALASCPIDSDDPAIDPDWGEPGLTPAEKLVAWNTFEVLAFRTGDPDKPVNAIPPTAIAHCQIRYTVDTDPADLVPALRRHLDAAGFTTVSVREADGGAPLWAATRLDPDDPWVGWAAASIERTTGQVPAVMPNLGGSLPNDAFAIILGLPTIWVPHSYAACSQHAPDEHGRASIMREGLGIMAGMFWDLGDAAPR